MTTEASWAEQFLESRRTLSVISGIILAFFVLTNLPWQLDDYDQAQQAFTSFEMVKEGHWFFQRTPHELVAQKPPLVAWASAATFAITRSWNVAWRLPCFAAAIALALALYREAKRAYGSAAALIALAAFGLNLLSARLATLVRTDMPLALVIFLTGLLIWGKIRAREPWQRRDRWWIFALLTASMFIKGPIVYALVLPGVILFQLFAAKRTGTTAWCGWWPWIASLAIFLVWPLCGIEYVPGFYHEVVLKEFLGRFSQTVHRSQPFLFYLPHLLHKFAPWALLTVGLGIASYRKAAVGLRNFLRETSPETFWLVCWALAGLLVMSLVPSKRVDRIYPIVPPLALLLAAQVAAVRRDGQYRERVLCWSAAAVILSVLSTGTYTAVKTISDYRDHADHLEVFSRDVNGQIATHHWRFEVISGDGGGYEGMLLYLQKPHFVAPAKAAEEWNAGQLEALVIPKDKLQALLPQLLDASVTSFQSRDRKADPQIGYSLVTRRS